MLKQRLIFGTLMTAAFVGLILLDGRLDGSLSGTPAKGKPQGTIFLILLCILAVPAQMELAALARSGGQKIFLPEAIFGSFLLAGSFFWANLSDNPERFLLYYFLFSLFFIFAGLFPAQLLREGVVGTLKNCSATLFSILYLGFLSSFVVGIRVSSGPWALLMYIFTIKSSDTGAYTFGKMFGTHKLAPVVSPKKTWEGLVGAVFGGALCAYLFSVFSGIMSPLQSVFFGAVSAVLGQMSDLCESMLKRDASQKDASASIPGFGGILDVIDSLLLPAPLAYLFFLWK
ncbi:MAG: phosphatidate cytidylyltransferase [Anaerohalosphaeraceae bacterium]